MTARRLVIPVILALVCGGAHGCGKLLGERYNSLRAGYTQVRIGIQGRQFLPHAMLDEHFNWDTVSFAAPTEDAAVYAINANNSSLGGQKFFSSGDLTVNSPKTWLIPNGSYYFSMVGFSASDMGSVSCALGAPSGAAAGSAASLSGGSVNITFTAGSCDSVFKDSAYTSFDIEVCPNGEAIGAKGVGDSCGTQSAGYVRLTIPSGDNFVADGFPNMTSSIDEAVHSGCLFLNTGMASGFLMPSGKSAYLNVARPRVVAKLFSDSSCATTPLATFYFPQGLSAADGNSGPVRGGTSSVSAAIVSDRARWTSGGTGVSRLFIREF